MNKNILNLLRTDSLVELDYLFTIDNFETLTKKFLKEHFTQDEVDKIIYNYDSVERIFHVKMERSVDFYKEFINKVLGFYRLPAFEYNKYKKSLDSAYKKIDEFKKYIEEQLEESNQNSNKLENEICKMNSEISKRKNNYEDYASLMKKKEEYVFEDKVKIANNNDKCKHYLKILDDEIKYIKGRWNEKHIRKCSIQNSKEKEISDNLDIYEVSLINNSEELFLPEYDYSINIKFSMQTRELIKEIERQGIGLDPKDYENLIKNMVEGNEYDSRKMEELKSTDINEYLNKLKKYIKENNICDYILENTKKNHAINYRYNVIEDSINLFKNDKYETFISIIPIQIEGIFHDYCRELEILPTASNRFTMGTKLSEIDKKIHFPFYEYYKFDFEVLRNKIAHGFIIQNEIELLAHELLLDLLALIYDINNNNKIPYLVAIEFLQKYSNEDKKHVTALFSGSCHKDECLIDYIRGEMFATDKEKDIRIRFKYILNPMYDKVYVFYDDKVYHCNYLKNSVLSVRNRITSKEFWNFVYNKFIKEELEYMNKQEVNMWRCIIDYIMLPYLSRNNYNETKEELAMISAKINSI